MENNLLGAELQLKKVKINRVAENYSSSLGIGVKLKMGLGDESNRVIIFIGLYFSDATKIPETEIETGDAVTKEVEEDMLKRREASIELHYELTLAEGREYTSGMNEDIWRYIYLQVNMQTTLMRSVINLPAFDLPLEWNSEM